MVFNSTLLAVWFYIAIVKDIILREKFLIISFTLKQPSDIHENTLPVHVITVTQGLKVTLSTARSLVRLDFVLA
jgi:hypothetical protein